MCNALQQLEGCHAHSLQFAALEKYHRVVYNDMLMMRC